jgi:hypothetical protein
MTTLSTILTGLDRRIPGSADRITMVDAINIALGDLGKVTKVDETLVVVDNQKTYSLPSGVTNVVRVKIATDSSEAEFDINYDWTEIDGSLYFNYELGYDAGNKIVIYYNDVPDEVVDDTDTISDDIPLALIVAEARYWYEQINFMDQSNLSAKDEAILEQLSSERNMARQTYRVRRMSKDPRLGSVK